MPNVVPKIGCKEFYRVAIPVLCVVLGLFSAANGQTNAEEKSVKVDKAFKISLQSNPSTGYKWEVSLHKAFLKLEADRFRSSTSPLVGAGGTQEFVLLPIRQGKTKVHFIYKRPWEKSIARKKTYILHISR